MPKPTCPWVKELSVAATTLGVLSLVPARADAAVVKGVGGPISVPAPGASPNFWDIDGTGGYDFKFVKKQ